jgi:hypothetical protein
MENIYKLCVPRESVFDDLKHDDTLDLTDLIQDRIEDQQRFFEENYVTEGMRQLVSYAFARFNKKSSVAVIKLTQSMGGGKTHNMIALGLLAKYPKLREKYFSELLKDDTLGEIEVIAFSGRERPTFGLWGDLAAQLNKKDDLNGFYSPLAAPGESEWIHLLKRTSRPLLILLDELPPYLEDMKSKDIGNSNLSKVTESALSNLFVAMQKTELTNVCVVISDLQASYEVGSAQIRATTDNLNSELSRVAVDLAPVNQSSGEVFEILRKRLFKSLPSRADMTRIASDFQAPLKQAENLGLSPTVKQQILLGMVDSYPFHPMLKELYGRFKENPGFQQTRGLIRLMRLVVRNLWERQEEKVYTEKVIINGSDFDLRDRRIAAMVSSIRPSLQNAISHDIVAAGSGTAEVVAQNTNVPELIGAAQLVLVSSLAAVLNPVVGLRQSEMLGYLAVPGCDLSAIAAAFKDYADQAWYLDFDGTNQRWYFKDTKNFTAELQSTVQLIGDDQARDTLKKYLEDSILCPTVKECYQNVQVFPTPDSVTLTRDSVTLVVLEPSASGVLGKTTKDFFDGQDYKNRILFLVGKGENTKNLLQRSKELQAVKQILHRMDESASAVRADVYKQVSDKTHVYELNFYSAIRECFCTIYYPWEGDELVDADFDMKFSDSKYNVEDQIVVVLDKHGKFTKDVDTTAFQLKCEQRLFTQSKMRWDDVLERAATNTHWTWHIPGALNDLRDRCIHRDAWRQVDKEWVVRGPFAKATDVTLKEAVAATRETSKATLHIDAQNGDTVHVRYDGAPATEADPVLDTSSDVVINSLQASFLCTDSKGVNETGYPVAWNNKPFIVRNMETVSDGQNLTLKSTINDPKLRIWYTTDGSLPKAGQSAAYVDAFRIPDDCKIIVAILCLGDMPLDQVRIPIAEKLRIDPVRPTKISKKGGTWETPESYLFLEQLAKHNGVLRGCRVTITVDAERWAVLELHDGLEVAADQVHAQLDMLISSFFADKSLTPKVSIEYMGVQFPTGDAFLAWLNETGRSLESFDKDIKQL